MLGVGAWVALSLQSQDRLRAPPHTLHYVSFASPWQPRACTAYSRICTRIHGMHAFVRAHLSHKLTNVCDSFALRCVYPTPFPFCDSPTIPRYRPRCAGAPAPFRREEKVRTLYYLPHIPALVPTPPCPPSLHARMRGCPPPRTCPWGPLGRAHLRGFTHAGVRECARPRGFSRKRSPPCV
ncbi:hypothetical protein C8F04DRAFT_68122 [Mycena alexandri]|uniref:Uncharacterized protein n=1 Tax=Mycena alexandri TaxID=1745969 RepID=A0AAD6SIW1_9AGAR|nr:hypothetical protein C8F04DRAFT_68122 [Mycena alexandri]